MENRRFSVIKILSVIGIICAITGYSYAQVPTVARTVTEGAIKTTGEQFIEKAATAAAVETVVTGTVVEKASQEAILKNSFDQAVLPTNLPNVPKIQPKRSWFTQQKRNYKAWKLKQQHRQATKAALELQALEKKLDLIARLQSEKSFETYSLLPLVPGSQAAPLIPLLEHPHYLYRGLGLPADGEAISNILQNGLLVKDAGQDANNLLLSLGSPHSTRAISHLQTTNLTTSPALAVSYAFKNVNFATHVPVIIKVKGIEQRAEVVRIFEDIPAAQIAEVIALLNIEGKPTWCRIEMHPDAGFLITPYQNF